MKIVSFNINSIRARPHQLVHLRDTIDPDVIGIQETKVNDPEFPIDEVKKIGYHSEFWGQKGHYGVAILSKIKPENVQKGFVGDSEDDQKRFSTPSEAIIQGADYIVVGRPITGADDTVAAVTRISEELAAL